MTPGFRSSASALMLALSIAAGSAAFDAGRAAQAGTLTLDSFSTDQRSRLFARLDQLAFFESGARVCGKPTSLESRLRQAAAECLSSETLETIVSTFRRKMNAATKTFDREAYCGDPKMPAILASFHESTNDLVGKVSAMCKACQITGMCK